MGLSRPVLQGLSSVFSPSSRRLVLVFPTCGGPTSSNLMDLKSMLPPFALYRCNNFESSPMKNHAVPLLQINEHHATE